jgi:hypothetical protein
MRRVVRLHRGQELGGLPSKAARWKVRQQRHARLLVGQTLMLSLRKFAVLSLALSMLGIGACGSSDNGPSDQAKQELERLKADIEAERQQIADERERARAKLADTRQEIADAKARLRRLKREAGQTRAAIDKSTIPGTGTFVVGEDIKPGTYRAAAQSGCYWARLSSLDTGDIIDNSNADGPVVVEITPSDKAFEASDCSDFHLVK